MPILCHQWNFLWIALGFSPPKSLDRLNFGLKTRFANSLFPGSNFTEETRIWIAPQYP